MKRKCWENEQHSKREGIEISGIPESIKPIDLENAVLCVIEKVAASVDPEDIEASYRFKSDDNGRISKVFVKFSKRNEMARVMNKKGSLKLLT